MTGSGRAPALTLVSHAYGLDNLALIAHAPILRVADVAVAKGPNGPDIWVLRYNGLLDILESHRTQGPFPLALEVVRSERGWGGFDRVRAVELDGVTPVDRVFFKENEGLVVGENGAGTVTPLFVVADAGVRAVAGVSWGDGPAVAIHHGDAGVRLVTPPALERWWWKHPAGRSLAVVPDPADGGAGPLIAVAEGRDTIACLDSTGNVVVRTRASAPFDRVAAIRLEADEGGWLVADRAIQVVAVDLNGDGRDEVAGVLPPDTLFVMSAQGRLMSRVTFNGSRLRIAGADLLSGKRKQLVVAGEGIGVCVVAGAFL